jgi:uncharacterized protein YlxW (UPF0749 family)
MSQRKRLGRTRGEIMTMKIDCCLLALVLAIANIITLAIFAGYTVKLRERQFLLEKKNGHEQKQLNQLKAEIELLKKTKNHEKHNKFPVKEKNNSMPFYTNLKDHDQ